MSRPEGPISAHWRWAAAAAVLAVAVLFALLSLGRDPERAGKRAQALEQVQSGDGPQPPDSEPPLVAHHEDAVPRARPPNPPSHRFPIRVVTKRGEPIAGSEVIVMRAASAGVRSAEVAFRGVSDRNGLLTADVRARRPLVVAARAIGFLPAEVTVAEQGEAPETEAIEIRLAEGKSLRVRFVYASGKPAPGVPVCGVGIGHDLRVLESEPVWRAYPGSGFASGVTGPDGWLILKGFGDEPVSLVLGPGWSYGHRKYPPDSAGEHWFTPVLRPGREEEVVVWRRGLLLLRLVDRATGAPFNRGFPPILIEDTSVQLDTFRGDDRPRPYGSATQRMDWGIYVGDGRFRIPIRANEPRDSVPVQFHFEGEPPIRVRSALCFDLESAERATHTNVRLAGPSAGIGIVQFTAPEQLARGLQSEALFGLRSVVNGKAVWTSAHYGYRSSASSFRVAVPAGEYTEATAFDGTLRCTIPFAVRAGSETRVLLEPRPSHLLRLTVETLDRAGRPVPNCSLILAIDDGKAANGIRILKNVAGRTFGLATDRWPNTLEVRVPIGKLEEFCNRPTYLTVRKPGFKMVSRRITLLADDNPQVVTVRLERAEGTS